MASDLSKLIQDSFSLTLNGLLAKDAKILQVTKAHEKDIDNLQLLKVQSTFEFANLTSQLSFILPAKSCSLIFNTMMGSPVDDLTEEIDDDAEDAIGEFVSNTSGTLTTSINGENFEDLGQAKFNIASKETIESSSITELDNLYKYQIDLEENELIIFVLFDEELLPYIEDTSNSEVTHYEQTTEDVEEEEKVQIPEEKEEINEEIPKNNEPLEDNISKEEIPAKTKKFQLPQDKKMKLIIMAAAGFIGFIILVSLIMYFTSASEPEIVEKKEDANSQKIIVDPNKVDVVKYKTPKKVEFKAADINKQRLNNKLQELTKFKVLNKEQIEAQKLAEKNRLFELEKEKELLAFAKRNIEEPLIMKKEVTEKKKEDNEVENQNITNTNKSDTLEIITVEENEIQSPIKNVDKELNYVVTTSLKYGLFKSLVQETTTNQARISICNDNEGKTTIYIGPFETKDLQEKMIELINKNNNTIIVKAENITEKEFNSKCNLE